MGEVIDFPVQTSQNKHDTDSVREQDPYYRFIRDVLAAADACGFELPLPVDGAAERVYLKTRDNSQLAQLLNAKD